VAVPTKIVMPARISSRVNCQPHTVFIAIPPAGEGGNRWQKLEG
jgi:hypothetical protein